MMFGFRNKADGAYVICGLGNPGREYENTRHNMGFRTVEGIARRFGVEVRKNKFNANIADIKHSGKRVILAKPLTYMNNSGDCVWKVAGFYRVELERLIVVYDDVDLPVGALRVRQFGGPGTHNGMKSITERLGSDRFPRIRVGIGKPPDFFDLSKYVLSGFSDTEKPAIEEAIMAAAKAALDIVEFGVEKAMNLNNQQKNRKSTQPE